MPYLQSHGWTGRRRRLIASAAVAGLGALVIIVFVYAGYHRGLDKSAGETALPELKPDTFRLLRTEQQTIPPIAVNGRTIDTITFGVFAFRYSHSNPLEFLGEFENKKFATRFTEYRIRKKFTWERFPTGYSSTGATTSILQPGVDYELLISLSQPGLSDAQQLRVSAESLNGTFWSEPFPYPKK